MFTRAEEYVTFARYVLEALNRHDCLLHAYVLMTNHVHLLITPRDSTGIGRMMQSVGRRYVRYFNGRHRRTGTLWEGRYRATLIESDRYLLACYRYIELNPLRAGLVTDPAEYRWSSYPANALGVPDQLVTAHQRYLDLAPDSDARRVAYRAMFNSPLELSTLGEIRSATHFAWALGSVVRSPRDYWTLIPDSDHPLSPRL